MASVILRPFFATAKASRMFQADPRTRVRRYQKTFEVYTGDQEVIGALEMYVRTPNLPRYGDIYTNGREYDEGAEVVNISAEQRDDNAPWLWTIIVDYSSETINPARTAQNPTGSGASEGGGGLNESPFLKPPQFTWGRIPDTYVLPISLDDVPKPFKNTAGTPFAQFPAVEQSRQQLTMVRNEAKYDAKAFLPYWDTLNQDPIWGYGAGEVKIDFITGNEGYSNKTAYAIVTYQFSIRTAAGWRWRPINKGPEALVGGKRQPVYGENNLRLSEVNLELDGTRRPDTDTPLILDFVQYPMVPWDNLSLPTKVTIPYRK